MIKGWNWPRTATIVLGLLAPGMVVADGPNFQADYKFAGSKLDSWRPVGQADWKAANGIITGTPKSPDGGWLMLDRATSNENFYAGFECTGGCKAGVLLRVEKSASGWTGILVSLSADDQNSYAIKMDTAGKIVSREKLGPGTGLAGLASAIGNLTPRQIEMNKNRPPGANRVLPLPAGVNMPELERPTHEYHATGWNAVNIVMYEDLLQPGLGQGESRAGDPGLVPSHIPDAIEFGQTALYVGGTAPVTFKDVQFRDLNKITSAKEYTAPDYTSMRLNHFYLSWSTGVGDVNHDGKPDLVAGPYYFLGPDFTEAHEIWTPHPNNPGSDYPQDSMVNLVADFTGDGWPDELVMSGSAGQGIATLYVNPQGKSEHWKSYVVIDPVGNEDTVMGDIDGDGKIEVVHSGNNALQYSKPDPANPTGRWITKTISEPGPWGVAIGHGLAIADVNGDGRMDVVNSYGWWEQPEKGSTALWKYHPVAFGRWGNTQGGAGGALAVYDVNGDGLPDVVATLEGHGYGLAWFEQKRSASGEISFERHIIMDNFLTKNAGDVIFTEPHALAIADMNGDGVPDIITGKRYMSHLWNYGDPDGEGPAVLYVYTTVRNKNAPGGAEFVPKLINNESGVGSHLVVTDLNGDGTADITTSGALGTFIFFNHSKQVGRATANAR